MKTNTIFSVELNIVPEEGLDPEKSAKKHLTDILSTDERVIPSCTPMFASPSSDGSYDIIVSCTVSSDVEASCAAVAEAIAASRVSELTRGLVLISKPSTFAWV